MTRNKYKVITNTFLANAIQFVTGQQPKRFPNRNYDPNCMAKIERWVYSFIVDEDFIEAFNLMIEAQKRLKQRPVEEEE